MKAAQFRNMTDVELVQQLEDIQKELFNLHVQKTTAQIEQPLRLRSLRRDIARIHTVKNERDAGAAQAEVSGE